MKTFATRAAAFAAVFFSAAAAEAALVYDLTFDELINTPVTVPGVDVEGVNVSYFGGAGATYGFGVLPSIFPGIDTPFLEGDADGVVTFAFEDPINYIRFNVALLTWFDTSTDVTVTIFNVGDLIPDAVFNYDLTTPGQLPVAQVELDFGAPIVAAVQVSFNNVAYRFAIDNLFATAIPEASTLALSAAGLLGVVGAFGRRGLRRRPNVEG